VLAQATARSLDAPHALSSAGGYDGVTQSKACDRCTSCVTNGVGSGRLIRFIAPASGSARVRAGSDALKRRSRSITSTLHALSGVRVLVRVLGPQGTFLNAGPGERRLQPLIGPLKSLQVDLSGRSQ